MQNHNVFVADARIGSQHKKVSGEIVSLQGEDYYKVSNYDAMPPFLMSIVSDSDHWMFISSTGGLTAGRKNSDHSIFPYYTDDKIHESSTTTGSCTIVRINTGQGTIVWTPFSDKYPGIYNSDRAIYKSLSGNAIIFEEINHDLQLNIKIAWMNSEKYGWVRKISLSNLSDRTINISILDGIQNILPSGILKSTQETFSTLMDAYKKAEIHAPTGTGIYSLSSIPVDRPEPSEALSATVVWTTAKNVKNILLSSPQSDDFIFTGEIRSESSIKGLRCSYLIETEYDIIPEKEISYLVIADLNKDSSEVNNLLRSLKLDDGLEQAVYDDINRGTANLKRIVGEADGIQKQDDKLASARHFSNVLFNVMRGGIYDQGYTIDTLHLKKHIGSFNINVLNKAEDWLDQLPSTVSYKALLEHAEKQEDIDLYRIILEYLPIAFSRRHGDPSRPWNRFSIDIKNPDGTRSLAYEGNWRDIFQNWEALSHSFPGFLPGIITKFLNASTIDGYNPYRITSEGIDWEILEPENPWSFIGYWGDHQIIYLLKLLEIYQNVQPGELAKWLNKAQFVYANVPYRIKSYDAILNNPNDTIEFDEEINRIAEIRFKESGADGKLVFNSEAKIVYATLAEKLLLPLLSKLSNFIPGAGIWMNTQRPEWNDANNALVGNGVSVVTLYYMRRYLQFLRELICEAKEDLSMSEPLLDFMKAIRHALDSYNSEASPGGIDDEKRKLLTDRLGRAGEIFRNKVYATPGSKSAIISVKSLSSFLNTAIVSLDKTIAQNKRKDKLYNAYNLVKIKDQSIEIEYLQAMLEGQVSVLSSNKLSGTETLELLDFLRNSELYRADQKSYMLYPDKAFDSFLDKNIIPADLARESHVIKKLIENGGCGILNSDEEGRLHFCKMFRNASILEKEMKTLCSENPDFNSKDVNEVLDIYERLFDHHSFTGRSGSFYKYEGLGSIYWHMVSKLLLAVGDSIVRFELDGTDQKILEKLKKHYKEIKEGVGTHKNPADYGAIPTDPYSHTPSMMGAQQPGMTGQVKEDIISRWIELGIHISDGKIGILPGMISEDEYKEAGGLKFSYCGTPFVYKKGESKGISVFMQNEKRVFADYVIDREVSSMVFERNKEVSEIVVVL